MRPRKPRKPLRPGDATKRMERAAAIRAQIDDENARHWAKMRDLTLARAEAQTFPLPATRSVRLTRISAQEVAERDRHRRTLERLRKRIAEL